MVRRTEMTAHVGAMPRSYLALCEHFAAVESDATLNDVEVASRRNVVWCEDDGMKGHGQLYHEAGAVARGGGRVEEEMKRGVTGVRSERGEEQRRRGRGWAM